MTRNFPYSHCIIDLDPEENAYDGFPLMFSTGVNVNETDEFKKSKMVLTMVDAISG